MSTQRTMKSLKNVIQNLIGTEKHTRRKLAKSHLGAGESLEIRQVTSAVNHLATDVAAIANPRVAALGARDDHTDDTLSRATLIRLNNSGAGQASGVLGQAGDRDLFRIDVSRDGAVGINVTANNSRQLDTILRVYDSQGRLIAENDDLVANQNVNSGVQLNLPRGTYYVQVGSYGDTGTGSYRVSVSRPAVPRDDHANSPGSSATAINLASNGSGRVTGTIERDGDRDTFKVTTNRDGQLTIVVAARDSRQLDTYLRVYDSQGRLVAEADDIDQSDSNSSIRLQVPRGTYYVQVGGYNDRGTGQYQVDVQWSSRATNSGFNIDLVFADNGLNSSQQNLFRQAANRWSQVIVGDLPDVTVDGVRIDDLRIIVHTDQIDGRDGTLAFAGPTAWRTESLLPCVGEMTFDLADNRGNANDLLNTIIHEMGHVLGIGTLWENFDLVANLSGGGFGYIGQNAVAQYNTIFGRNSQYIPLEDGGGEGTAGAHWEEDILGTEILTGYIDGGRANQLSRITVGALADMGYQVNYNAADAFNPRSSVVGVRMASPAVAADRALGSALAAPIQAMLMQAPTTSLALGSENLQTAATNDRETRPVMRESESAAASFTEIDSVMANSRDWLSI